MVGHGLRLVPWVALGAALAAPAAIARAEVSRFVVRRPGDRPATLAAELEVRIREGGRLRSFAPRLHAQGGSLLGEAGDVDVAVTVRVEPASDGGADVRLDLAYRAAVRVEAEELAILFHGRGQALGRDLRIHPVARPLRVDRGTPIFALLGEGAALTGGEGVFAARYLATAHGLEVGLILDDRGTHPLRREDACPAHRWLAPAPLVRRRGDEVSAAAHLDLLDDAAGPLPLILERWKGGVEAEIVITDHADRTDAATLRAVLFGTSDPRDPAYGKRGLLGRGLPLTRTFFATGKDSPLLTDPAIRALADAIRDAGGEVALHSPSPGPDHRATIRSVLARLHGEVVTWIDHRPATNCEALSNRGSSGDPSWRSFDLLVAAGIRWVWAATDVGWAGRHLNLFRPAQAAGAYPPVFPIPGPRPADGRLWAFASEWFYEPAGSLARALDEANLVELERERGLFVAHTYLGAGDLTSKNPVFRRRGDVRRTRRGALELVPALDAAFERLAAHVHAGTLAVDTWRTVGERLIALGEVEVRYRHDGAASIRRRDGQALAGLTVAVPREDVEIRVDGAAPLGERHEKRRTTFWFDLPAGRAVVVEARAGATPLPFLATATVVAERAP